MCSDEYFFIFQLIELNMVDDLQQCRKYRHQNMDSSDRRHRLLYDIVAYERFILRKLQSPKNISNKQEFIAYEKSPGLYR